MGLGKINQIGQLLGSGEVSCVELTLDYLRAINEDNLKFNAYVNVTENTALATAQKVDDKIKNHQHLSPLEGVPFAMKDNLLTSGIETTCCSNMLKGFIPSCDATVWSILRRQNAILLGKTNMDEFAMGCSGETSCFGGVSNPHDTSRVAGGSSSGSAAAVAAGLAVYALGSDTGGSIRQPCSFCGAVGLKPTYGAVSRYGLVDFAPDFDQVGPMATCVEDVAIVFDQISHKDHLDTTSIGLLNGSTVPTLQGDIKGLRIGLPRQYFDGIKGDVKRSLDNAIDIYQSLGAEFLDLDMPELNFALPVYYVLAYSQGADSFEKFDGFNYVDRSCGLPRNKKTISMLRSQGFGEEVKRRITFGAYILNSSSYSLYRENALKMKKAICTAFERSFQRCDLLLGPTVPRTAFEHSFVPLDRVESNMTDICTVPVNIAGLPALSLPCGWDSNGLPIGLQLIANKFQEGRLLCAGYRFEECLNAIRGSSGNYFCKT